MMSNLEAPSREERLKEEIIGGRYRALRSLGEGGMGTVLLVLDRRQDYRPLALKRVACGHVDSRLLSVLRREFLILASLRHPHLPRVYDFGRDTRSGDVYFTSEYVRGIPWNEATASLDLRMPEGLDEFLSLLAQVLRTLGFVHLLGKVHGDIKPANVLVRPIPGRATAGHATLIDFGLTRGERELTDRIVGTPYYVAPESLTNSGVDRRGDLYSLGMVLYELVTGQRPFAGLSHVDLFKAHLGATPVPVREVAPETPAALARVIDRLIEKRPEDRFQCAADVLVALGEGFGRKLPLETDATLEAHLERGRWLATERGQRVLQRVASRALRRPRESRRERLPSSRCVLLTRSDLRRSHDLVRAFRQRAQARGTSFLEIESTASPGSCDAAAGVSAWSCLLRELCNYENVFEGETRPEYIRRLASLPTEQGRARSTAFFESCLIAAAETLCEASLERPLVLCLREVDLSDPLLAGFLSTLLDCSSQRPSRVLAMVLVSAGERGRSAGEVLESLRERHSPLELAVSGFDERSLGRLLRRTLPGCDFPSEFVRALDAESEGELETVWDALRALLRDHCITRTAQGWSLSISVVGGSAGEPEMRLPDRIRALPRPAYHLGSAFACLARPASLAIAAELVGQSAAESASALQVLLDARLLTTCESERFGFARDSVREAYYEQVPEEDRRELHRRAGCLWESGEFAQQRGRTALAYHFLRADEPLKAVHYGLHAARELGRRFAARRAVELYEQVLNVAASDADLSSAQRPPVCGLDASVSREMADLRFQLGDFRGAAACLEGLLECEPEGERAPLLELEAARVFIRLGRFARAARCLRAAQRAGADKFPVGFTRIELAHFRGDLRTSLRLGTRLLEENLCDAHPELLCELFLLMAENYSELQDTATAAALCRRGAVLLKGKEEPHLVALRHFCRAKQLGYRGRPRDAAAILRLSRKLWARLGVRGREADCLYEAGRLQFVLCCPARAQRLLARALRRYEETGDLRGELRTRFLLAEVVGSTGDIERSQRLLAETLRAAPDVTRKLWARQASLLFAELALDGGDLENAGRYLYDAAIDCGENDGVTDRARAGLLRARLSYQSGELGEALVEATAATRQAEASRDPIARRRAWLRFGCYQVGFQSEAGWRRALDALRDTASRDVACEGPVALLEGAWWARNGQSVRARRSFLRSQSLLKIGGEERDLALLLLEQGLLALAENDPEQAYLHLEEGAGLARRLRLSHLRCRYFLALGRLEELLSPEDGRRALERFLFAHKLAEKAGFSELLWQTALCVASASGTDRAIRSPDGAPPSADALADVRRALQEVLAALGDKERNGYLSSVAYTLGAERLSRVADPVQG